ncbi:hypothetical protein HPB50_004417 [Hyalomma asiaticum]|uniref:Uncharacterized protein n=1 Tax=Hyalomma asiaticum TaxID=266040 RepID=A0ACB7TCT9_HYAAI|nr:hypothetical protein HPB50_004417 [Hyalomma asiaticum]
MSPLCWHQKGTNTSGPLSTVRYLCVHIIGPISFDNTLTAQRYVDDNLGGPVSDVCCDVPLAHLRQMWFQHDVAAAHSSRWSRKWLDEVSPGQ